MIHLETPMAIELELDFLAISTANHSEVVASFFY